MSDEAGAGGPALFRRGLLQQDVPLPGGGGGRPGGVDERAPQLQRGLT